MAPGVSPVLFLREGMSLYVFLVCNLVGTCTFGWEGMDSPLSEQLAPWLHVFDIQRMSDQVSISLGR